MDPHGTQFSYCRANNHCTEPKYYVNNVVSETLRKKNYENKKKKKSD